MAGSGGASDHSWPRTLVLAGRGSHSCTPRSARTSTHFSVKGHSRDRRETVTRFEGPGTVPIPSRPSTQESLVCVSLVTHDKFLVHVSVPRGCVPRSQTMSLIGLCTRLRFCLSTPDNAVSRKTKIPVRTEEESTIGDSPAPSALAVLRCGARPPTSCGRDEREERVPEGKAQGGRLGPDGHKVSVSPLGRQPDSGGKATWSIFCPVSAHF